ncbi:FMN-dependent dehydrogenase family protein [Polychytrium aggregatum]|uniref:FMN-dependent dehydrogenase family protein n=1 Tax=Polychytrium aggregatum TaxID=110093 RepID=UPI0022FE8CEB|nr:FMN-dependent dehydrogenase family protein [Polychytrium aggregatum]KAI9201839.1 FMN-dependent dehydrogenase family protein [Polychytrium aggregatum]
MATQKLAVPPLSSVLNLFDFEAVARRVLTPNAWAYYSSGADDELTLRENHSAFHRIWFRPRVLRNVRDVRLETVFLGSPTKLPIYITATALGKLGHPQGEVALTRAAGTRGIVQMMPTLASCSLDEMMDAAVPGQSQWFQLYVNPNRELTRKIVQHAEARGCKGLFITVDAPALGHREKDMRTKFEIDAPKVQGSVSERTQGAARAISGFIDPTLDWDDIRWFRSITKMPIALKGIQTAEDALLAHQHGIDAIVLSNHGGRQLDTSRSAIEILVEVMSALEHEGIVGKMEVYVDGGFKRGSDIVKALALGATGVGIGRPFLYAMSGYGQEGVERALDLLKDEMEMVMRMLGARSLKELTRSMVITKDLTTHAGVSIRDNLSEQIYEPLAYTSVDPAKLPASKL